MLVCCLRVDCMRLRLTRVSYTTSSELLLCKTPCSRIDHTMFLTVLECFHGRITEQLDFWWKLMHAGVQFAYFPPKINKQISVCKRTTKTCCRHARNLPEETILGRTPFSARIRTGKLSQASWISSGGVRLRTKKSNTTRTHCLLQSKSTARGKLKRLTKKRRWGTWHIYIYMYMHILCLYEFLYYESCMVTRMLWYIYIYMCVCVCVCVYRVYGCNIRPGCKKLFLKRAACPWSFWVQHGKSCMYTHLAGPRHRGRVAP